MRYDVFGRRLAAVEAKAPPKPPAMTPEEREAAEARVAALPEATLETMERVKEKFEESGGLLSDAFLDRLSPEELQALDDFATAAAGIRTFDEEIEYLTGAVEGDEDEGRGPGGGANRKSDTPSRINDSE